jgi:hypothetical protein
MVVLTGTDRLNRDGDTWDGRGGRTGAMVGSVQSPLSCRHKKLSGSVVQRTRWTSSVSVVTPVAEVTTFGRISAERNI